MRQGANSKAKNMRKRGFRKGSIHFHIGFLKTQDLEASHCSLCFWMSDCSCWILFLTILDSLMYKQNSSWRKRQSPPFLAVRRSNPSWF